jgi:diaminopimelate epimerase
MEIRFWKMHGAGNDFIMVDDRTPAFPLADREWIARLAARRTGVGCEGVILIQRPSHPKEADFRMRFLNPDGGEVDMCGNGARCVARLAHDLGAAAAGMRIETGAGILHADIVGQQVRLRMTRPRDWRLNATLVLRKGELKYSSVNSGVPHVVVEVPQVEETDVAETGAQIRYHGDFAPAGTNANFMEITGPQSLRIRTYERGVEGETLACGTGIVAAALIAGKLGRVKPPVQVSCSGGEALVVDYQATPEGADAVTLLGPAAYVYKGTLDYAG